MIIEKYSLYGKLPADLACLAKVGPSASLAEARPHQMVRESAPAPSQFVMDTALIYPAICE
jgi:hypothetical protein